MPKIRDRLILGVISGLTGNVPKLGLVELARRRGWAEVTGPTKAAGMLVSRKRLSTAEGRVVGYIADGIIAALLGVASVYLLSVTGRDKAALKGAISGQVIWSALYGVLSTMGATTAHPTSPRTVLTEFVAHTAYGATTASVATLLGDPALFTGGIPLSASPACRADKTEPPAKQDTDDAVGKPEAAAKTGTKAGRSARLRAEEPYAGEPVTPDGRRRIRRVRIRDLYAE